ncbi:hypothetical protein NPIL_308501 [Nephila pilipes]|uniref:Uncharacterized protein n=1 Tax=Nephila pilipes TaxID=299642 RepID=A0A8X6M8Z3_NEPPI|nr:hypothetical protein NPIL_308501 [Nephila pilipes]
MTNKWDTSLEHHHQRRHALENARLLPVSHLIVSYATKSFKVIGRDKDLQGRCRKKSVNTAGNRYLSKNVSMRKIEKVGLI